MNANSCLLAEWHTEDTRFHDPEGCSTGSYGRLSISYNVFYPTVINA